MTATDLPPDPAHPLTTTEPRSWTVFGTVRLHIPIFSARTWTQYYFNRAEKSSQRHESGSERPTDSRRDRYEVIFKMRDVYLAKPRPIQPTTP